MTSREAILQRIRQAVGTPASETEIPRLYNRGGAGGSLEEMFEERLRHYQADVHRAGSSVRESIASILQGRGKTRMVFAREFPKEWMPGGLDAIEDGPLDYKLLDGVDGVVTECALAVALTGTLVLASGPQDGLRASTLIPDYHLCVVRLNRLVETLPEAFARLDPLKTRALTFVSGPSATVDIEMTRVKGVHGPRTLDVLLV